MVQVVRGLVVPSLKHHPSTNTNKARHLVRGMIPLSSAATWQALSGLSRGSCAACLRRSIFSLPDFSSLSPLLQAGESQPPPYHERKIFPYTRRQLYNVVTDVDSYTRFVPFCVGSKILSRSRAHTQDGHESVVMDAELTIGFLSFCESYASKVTCHPFDSVEAIASSSTPLFKTLETLWRFQHAMAPSPHLDGEMPLSSRVPRASDDPDHGPTLVTLDLKFAFANPVHAAVSSAFFGQVSKLMVKAFEERCMQVYGQEPPL